MKRDGSRCKPSQVVIAALDRPGGPELAPLTFPVFAPWVNTGWSRDVLGAAAFDDRGRPIGLILGRTEAAAGKIVSCFVMPDARGKGIAVALLEGIRRMAKSRGVNTLEAEIPVEGNAAPVRFRHDALVKAGWVRTAQSQVVVDSEAGALTKLMDALTALAPAAVPLSMAPWQSESPPFSVPPEVDPARYLPHAPDGRPAASDAAMAFRENGRLAGWAIGHDMGAGWLRVTSLYFSQDTGTRPALDALARYFALVAAADWARVTFSTSHNFPMFQRFCMRRADREGIVWALRQKYRMHP